MTRGTRTGRAGTGRCHLRGARRRAVRPGGAGRCGADVCNLQSSESDSVYTHWRVRSPGPRRSAPNPYPACMPRAKSLVERIDGTDIEVLDARVDSLQQALAAGALTSARLTEFYVRRIERLNPGLHAVIAVSPDWEQQAAASDAARARGAVRGPLEGIPVLVKDNIAVAGQPATAGSPALEHAESGDASLVTGLRACGAVIIGKANLSEWANIRSTQSSSGWSTLGGQAVNPHGPGRNPSGSSSGSAVAVAAGLAPVAVGTETNGSIVSPASACGVVGLKPTLGLISRSGIVPISAAQDTAGPMTSCVADAAALLGAL